jgi:hypothetical protein
VHRCVLGFYALVALAPRVGACATDPYVTTTRTVSSGLWKIERQVDRVTGQPLSSAWLQTRESATAADPFTKPASLQLMCLKEQPVVRIGFQFKVGTTRSASLGYRFDDKPGHEAIVRFLSGSQVVVIDDRAEVARFANGLSTSKLLYLRIRALNHPRSSAEFEVDGGHAAVESAFASCPIFGPRPQHATLY